MKNILRRKALKFEATIKARGRRRIIMKKKNVLERNYPLILQLCVAVGEGKIALKNTRKLKNVMNFILNSIPSQK